MPGPCNLALMPISVVWFTMPCGCAAALKGDEMPNAATEWLDRYEADKNAGIMELINLILEVCALPASFVLFAAKHLNVLHV